MHAPSTAGAPADADAVLRALSAAEAVAAAPASRFCDRAAAIDLLELHVLDRLQALGQRGPLEPRTGALQDRATAASRRLAAANGWAVRGLRREIRTGQLSGAALRRALLAEGGPPGRAGAYAALDVLVAELLDGGAPGAPRAALSPGMVAYQPAPVRAVLQLLARSGPRAGERFVDLGAGLGHVVLLVALLAGVRARGVEIEPAYCACARRSARRLGVAAEFVEGDARDADLGGGDVYFLFTPFRGEILATVLRRLEREARTRPLRVCTLGPATREVARAAWLRAAPGGALRVDEVQVFHSGP